MKTNNNALILGVSALLFIFAMAITSTASAAGPAIVNLGSITTNNFVVLSKAAITNVPTSNITGNIGASPITGASIGVTCAEMTGTIYTVDAAYTGSGDVTCVLSGPGANKTLVDNAVLDMGIVYTDAATRTSGTGATNLNVGGGTLSGQDFTPGTYTWDTPGDVNITGDITITGSATDVFIFQITGNLTLSNGIHINLVGGAVPSHIFWQVAGETVLGTTSVFNGNILSGGVSTIALQTGATLHGRALSQFEVTLQANTIEAVDPVVVVVIPPADVPLNLVAVTGVQCGGMIDLSWNTSANATSYEVARGATLVGTTTVTSFSDTAPSVGNPFTYTVRAVNASSTSVDSNSASALSSQPCPSTVPAGSGSSGGGGGGGGGFMSIYTGGNTTVNAGQASQYSSGGQVLGASTDPATQAQITSLTLQLRGLILQLIIALQMEILTMQRGY